MNNFKKGYKSFEENFGSYGLVISESYINAINDEINNLSTKINKFKIGETNLNQIKGYIAEFWHSGTQNIDAALKDLKVRTEVQGNNGLASVDIKSSDGTNYGLKYYSNGEKSAIEQSKSFYEKYKKAIEEYKLETIKYEDYLKHNGKDPNLISRNDPIYESQVRIIPKDQLEEAIRFLKRMINEELFNNKELVYKYQETLDNLTDRIKSSKGSESIPLSHEDALILAKIAKDGNFDPSEFGFITEELIRFRFIINQALKAGITSATITAVLIIAPKLFSLIENTINKGELNKEDLLNLGLESLQGGSDGFIKGSISAALTTACMAGNLGFAMKNIDPLIIGASTVILLNVVRNSIKLSQNKISKGEFANLFFRDLFVSTSAVVSGGITQGLINIPIFSYLVGSFVGAMVASFIYDKCYKTYIGLCEDTYFTFFGIVDQDYLLSKDLLESIGIEVFDYEKFNLLEFDYNKLNIKKFEFKKMEQKKFHFQFIRRGVIEINRIGYV